MKFVVCLTAWLAGAIGLASATPGRRIAEQLLARDDSGAQATANYTIHYFNQPIDHFPQEPRYAPHVNGTYKHRYFLSDQYYKPGGPVFLYLAGEASITNNTVLNQSLIVSFMKQFNGIGIVLENRYYGVSNPFNTSTTDQLRYLTTEQVIADFDTFARQVRLPGHPNINAPGTPWILYGGSYPGSLSAFSMKTYGNTFYAGIASSAVIHAQLTYEQWYNPIQLLAPQDCMASINDIVDKIDMLVAAKNTAAIKRLKQVFGLQAVTDIRDFANAIAFPIGGPLFYPTRSFQEINWNPAVGHQDFFEFCHNVTNIDPPANNTAIDNEFAKYTNGQPWHDLGNYAAYVKQVVLPLCPSGEYNSPTCFGTQHPAYLANTTNSASRSYLYTACTEFGAYQAAMPSGQKSLISRVIDANYTQDACNRAFPRGKYNTIPPTPDLQRWNVYGDFNLTADRLMFVDGSADVWRDLTYHSEFAPQRYWSDLHPVQLTNGAGHVWDLRTLADVNQEPQFMRETTLIELRTVGRWLKAFGSWKPT